MIEVVSREEWGARSPKSRSQIPDHPKGFGLHWNGPPMNLIGGCNNGSLCAAKVRQIQNYHMDEKEWYDLAYSYLVCPSCGRIYEGRTFGIRTAANGTNRANNKYHAVMVMFGEGEPFTDQAKVSVLYMADLHENEYGTSEIRPHRKFKSTGCPGPEATKWARNGAPPPDMEDGSDKPKKKKEVDDMTVDVITTNDNVYLLTHPYIIKVPNPAKGQYFINLAKSKTNSQYKGPYNWSEDRINNHPVRQWLS